MEPDWQSPLLRGPRSRSPAWSRGLGCTASSALDDSVCQAEAESRLGVVVAVPCEDGLTPAAPGHLECTVRDHLSWRCVTSSRLASITSSRAVYITTRRLNPASSGISNEEVRDVTRCAGADCPSVARPALGSDDAGIIFADSCYITGADDDAVPALSEGSLQALQQDAQLWRSLPIRLSLHLVPFAGIAFPWFIGVVREQLGNVEDRLFSDRLLGQRAALPGDAVSSARSPPAELCSAMLAGSRPQPRPVSHTAAQHHPDADLHGPRHADGRSASRSR